MAGHGALVVLQARSEERGTRHKKTQPPCYSVSSVGSGTLLLLAGTRTKPTRFQSSPSLSSVSVFPCDIPSPSKTPLISLTIFPAEVGHLGNGVGTVIMAGSHPPLPIAGRNSIGRFERLPDRHHLHPPSWPFTEYGVP
jgi:hypothetical protein